MDKIFAIINSDYLGIVKFFIENRVEFIVNTISGIIGGFIVYLYVIHQENKRDARIQQRELNKDRKDEKEKCTSALLNTQMTIIFQMETSKSLEALIQTILDFSFADSTLEKQFKHNNSEAEIAIILREYIICFPTSFKDLQQLVNYLEIPPMVNNIIALPYEIFAILNIPLKKALNEAELAQYFGELARCNKKYNQLIARVLRINTIRDSIMDQLISKIKIDSTIKTLDDEDRDAFLGIIAGIFVAARSSKNPVNEHLKMANQALLKTAEYIELLDISKPIPILRDETGQPSFTKVSTDKKLNENEYA